MPGKTTYNADMQAKAEAYVRGGYESCGDCVPSVAGLAVELGKDRKTMQNWGKQHEDFRAILDECETRQHRVALNGGLRGDFNAAITKLLLHNHGYSDKAAQEISGPGGGAINVRDVEDLSDEELMRIAAGGE